MKKIVVASDSFKGSLTSAEVAEHAAKGIRRFFPDCEVREVSVADGGEGTIDALINGLNGTVVTTVAHDPLMRTVNVQYGIMSDKSTAVIEMAEASGLTRLAPTELDPLNATSYGSGEIIAEALRDGFRDFIIGVGGTATTDGGTGLLQALGFAFLDNKGNDVGEGGQSLARIRSINSDGVMPEATEARFTVLCDVNNPLTGQTGSANVFSPQKGASSKTVSILEKGLNNFACTIRSYNGKSVCNFRGAGAGGGAAAGLYGLLGATVVPGAKYILDRISFGETLVGADLIITGEGKLDLQSSNGKLPFAVLKMGLERDIPVVAITGSMDGSYNLNTGFTGVFPIIPSPVSLERAMEKDFASYNVEHTAGQIAKLFYSQPKS